MAEDQAAPTKRRTGRGRLSSIEELPACCGADFAWVNAALRERSMPQVEILRQFNERLARLGIKAVSKGAFSRYSVRIAMQSRDIAASHEITEKLLAQVAAQRPDPSARGIVSAGYSEAARGQREVLVAIMTNERPNPDLISAAAELLVMLIKEGQQP